MDYLVWGEEYLREAEHLRERVRLLRRQAADATEEKRRTSWRGGYNSCMGCIWTASMWGTT